jgi:hypothetical protein
MEENYDMSKYEFYSFCKWQQKLNHQDFNKLCSGLGLDPKVVCRNYERKEDGDYIWVYHVHKPFPGSENAPDWISFRFQTAYQANHHQACYYALLKDSMKISRDMKTKNDDMVDDWKTWVEQCRSYKNQYGNHRILDDVKQACFKMQLTLMQEGNGAEFVFHNMGEDTELVIIFDRGSARSGK